MVRPRAMVGAALSLCCHYWVQGAFAMESPSSVVPYRRDGVMAWNVGPPTPFYWPPTREMMVFESARLVDVHTHAHSLSHMNTPSAHSLMRSLRPPLIAAGTAMKIAHTGHRTHRLVCFSRTPTSRKSCTRSAQLENAMLRLQLPAVIFSRELQNDYSPYHEIPYLYFVTQTYLERISMDAQSDVCALL